MRKLDKTETLVTRGDMTYVREVTKLTCIVVCVYISSLTQFAYFLMLSMHRFCCCSVFAQRVTLTLVRVTHFNHYPIYNFSIYLLFLSVNMHWPP